MPPAFIRAYPPAQPETRSALWFAFRDNDLLLLEREDGLSVYRGEVEGLAAFEPGPLVYLGTLHGEACVACELGWNGPAPEGWRLISLRSLFGQVDDQTHDLAGYAIRLLNWQHAYNFCDACGHKTEWFGGDWGKRCTNCGKTAYPPVSPAILVLIHDGDKILLTHKAGWGPRYSIIAGFIEPGESIEECVSREAYEEVGVEIDQITYFGSQSWPFPHQLMIGYMANYAGGEITIDAHELDDARWFHIDELPELPGPSSLSRQLINAWIRKYRPNAKQLLA